MGHTSLLPLHRCRAVMLQVDRSEEPFSWATPDVDGLRALCQRVLGWDRDQIDGLLMPMVKVKTHWVNAAVYLAFQSVEVVETGGIGVTHRTSRKTKTWQTFISLKRTANGTFSRFGCMIRYPFFF